MASPVKLTMDANGFPRATSHAVWMRLTPRERQAVVEALPSEFDLAPPEGPQHFDAKAEAKETLKRYFQAKGRSVYLAAEMAVYYPAQPVFAPDVIAIVDVPVHDRERWVMNVEGKGVDFALEIHVHGDRKNDAERNVAWYASLGIPEYFTYDRRRQHLQGYRLAGSKARRYWPIAPQYGKLHSEVLRLDLAIEDDKLRFFDADARLPDADELIDRLQRSTDALQAKYDDAERRVQELEAKLRGRRKK